MLDYKDLMISKCKTQDTRHKIQEGCLDLVTSFYKLIKKI